MKNKKMATEDDLVRYIRSCLERGFQAGQIKQLLVERGWPENYIDNAFNEVINARNRVNYPKNEEMAAISGKKTDIFVKILAVTIFVTVLAIVGIITFLSLDEKKPDLNKENMLLSAGGNANSLPDNLNAKDDEESIQVKDCADNFQCFIKASKNCEHAKVEHTYATSNFGVKKTTAAYYEMKGIEEGKCIFYIKTKRIDIKYSRELILQMEESGISSDAIMQKELVENIKSDSSEGKEATCKILVNDLAEELNNWKNNDLKAGIFSEKILKYAGCEGNYFS